MQELNILSDATQNFLVSTFAASLAAFGLVGAFDVLNRVLTFERVQASDEDLRGLRSIMLLASVSMLATLLPLALSDVASDMRICSAALLCASAISYTLILRDIVSGRTVVHFPKVTYPLLAVSAAWIAGLLLNTILYVSLTFYKLSIMWLLAVLFTRLVMFMFYLSQLSIAADKRRVPVSQAHHEHQSDSREHDPLQRSETDSRPAGGDDVAASL